jgi:hypothetical protein
MNETRPYLLYKFLEFFYYFISFLTQPAKYELTSAYAYTNGEIKPNDSGCTYSARTYSVWLCLDGLYE